MDYTEFDVLSTNLVRDLKLPSGPANRMVLYTFQNAEIEGWQLTQLRGPSIS